MMLKYHMRFFLVVACSMVPCPAMFAQQPTPGSSSSLTPASPSEEDPFHDPVDARVDHNSHQTVALETLILGKLRKSNDAEIALGQLAAQRATAPVVKALAAHLIEDHQQMNEQLDQLYAISIANVQPSETRAISGGTLPLSNGRSGARDTGGIGASGAAAAGGGQGGEANTPRESRLNTSEVGGAGEASIGASGDAVGGKGQGGAALKTGVSQGVTAYSDNARGNTDPSGLRTAGVSNPSTLDSGDAGETTPRQREPQTADAVQPSRAEASIATLPAAYWNVVERTYDNELTLTREMLTKHEGHDFDSAYLGQQLGAHIHTLAELRAIESSGPAALKATASNAKVKVLEHLKDIMQALATVNNAPSVQSDSAKP